MGCLVYVPPGRPPRWLTASLDDREIGRIDLSTLEGWATLRFPLPHPVAPEAAVLVRLDIDQPFPTTSDARLP